MPTRLVIILLTGIGSVVVGASKIVVVVCGKKKERERERKTYIKKERKKERKQEGAGPDLGMGKLGSCPRASTKRRLHIFHEQKNCKDKCLALMSIEYDILREIDFDKLIQDFARVKSRKVSGR